MALLLFLSVVVFAGQEEYEKQLERTKSSIKKKMQELARLNQRKSSLMKRIEGYDELISQESNLIFLLSERLESTKSAIDSLELSIQQIGFLIDERQERLSILANTLYRRGRIQPLELYFSSESVPELLRRVKFLLKIGSEYSHQIHILEQNRAKLSGMQAELLSLKSSLEKMLSEHEEALAMYKAEKEEQAKLVSQLVSQEKQLSEAVSSLEKYKKKLEKILDNLSRKRRLPGKSFAHLRGNLPWPVSSGRIVRGFGVSRGGSVSLKNDGIDIEASPGEKVLAVYEGEVSYIGSFRGYGMFVILSHPGGYFTVYGNLASVLVKEGKRVSGGDVLGVVGSNWYLGGALHFELYYGRSVEDPTDWLAPSGRA
ncbi:peptidoglycan DD-metalloendopeptidase family protein [bacterium]|nr:peptidoglycan DD-metalloendopeptidase family protein [bacterium]